jgi:hypothetical protein
MVGVYVAEQNHSPQGLQRKKSNEVGRVSYMSSKRSSEAFPRNIKTSFKVSSLKGSYSI